MRERRNALSHAQLRVEGRSPGQPDGDQMPYRARCLCIIYQWIKSLIMRSAPQRFLLKNEITYCFHMGRGGVEPPTNGLKVSCDITMNQYVSSFSAPQFR